MTAHEFRRMALSFRETAEGAHMEHPDFRVGGKIFATRGYPRAGWAMVKLMPDQLRDFVRAQPKAFVAVRGKWGARGDQCDLEGGEKRARARGARGCLAEYRAETDYCGFGWRKPEGFQTARVNGARV